MSTFPSPVLRSVIIAGCGAHYRREMRYSNEQIESSVVWSLIRAAHLVERRVTAVFADHQLSPAQFGVLVYLAANGQMTQAELARSTLVRPQTLARVLDGMQERGLLTRTAPRQRGRRNAAVVSAAGRRVLDEVYPAFLAANDLSDLGLSARSAAQLSGLLAQITGGAHRD